MVSAHLNLARKWRSKNFDQIIGQDLSVRMLKNSLYLDQLFPVYLFSGQRGCGKTTTARVFAAAINCDQLSDFQKKPKDNIIPCGICGSCQAMALGKHPDFIEIDAASHTGVDNVRSIIDAASLLPLMGSKKIYLIDEAHMLSKASFNAFLKILEEPPASVVFILATTDPEKIIETVRSRCFTLFFKAVSIDPLCAHLENICYQEKISYDQDGLALIVRETDGSVRDAINLLEQVRFSHSRVTRQAVLTVLGHISEEDLLELFEIIVSHGTVELLNFIQKVSLPSYDTEFVWRKLLELIRAGLWVKHGVVPTVFVDHYITLQRILRECSWNKLDSILDSFYASELVFLRTTERYSLLEMLLLRLCQKNAAKTSSNNNSHNNNSPATVSATPNFGEITDQDYDDQDDQNDQDDQDDQDDNNDQDGQTRQQYEYKNNYDLNKKDILWAQVLQEIMASNDQRIISLFSQGSLVSYDPVKQYLVIEFSQQLVFLTDMLNHTKNIWQSIINTVFSVEVTVEAQFTGPASKIVNKAKPVIINPIAQDILSKDIVSKDIVSKNFVLDDTTQKKNIQKSYSYINKDKKEVRNNSNYQRNARVIPEGFVRVDVSDHTKWPVATQLVRAFPGIVYEMRSAS